MSSSSNSGGTSLLGVLVIVFIVLKLVGVINWSWWLVLLPLWGGFLTAVVVLGLTIVVAVISELL